jgi:hypothetical protein
MSQPADGMLLWGGGGGEVFRGQVFGEVGWGGVGVVSVVEECSGVGVDDHASEWGAVGE